jgi:hydrogenase maturation protease
VDNWEKTMKDTLVAGLGNPLMGDEGVGVLLVHRIEAQFPDLSDVEFLDAGTGGVALVHAMAGRGKVIFIDCARMGEEAGTMRRFGTEQVRSRKHMPGLSLHEADLMDIIDLARRLGQCPEEIVIFGIEPGSIDQREGLSPELQKRLPHYVRRLLDEIRPDAVHSRQARNKRGNQ